LEHLDVPEVEERLAVILGDTDTCPHGHRIPIIRQYQKGKAVPLTRISGFAASEYYRY